VDQPTAADSTDDAEDTLSAGLALLPPEDVRVPEPVTSAPAVAAPRPKRLAGLDGLRGLAALYIVIYHVFLRAFHGFPLDHVPFWAGFLTTANRP
jgi:hypothetical protein